jgi:hypothetical protein
MQAYYKTSFEREMGLTEPEFRRCLPGAFEPLAISLGRSELTVPMQGGHLTLSWHAMPPRVIALATLPRLHVRFDFGAVDEAERQRVMRRFDLVMLRGGG